jgi:hypothetical protein
MDGYCPNCQRNKEAKSRWGWKVFGLLAGAVIRGMMNGKLSDNPGEYAGSIATGLALGALADLGVDPTFVSPDAIWKAS